MSDAEKPDTAAEILRFDVLCDRFEDACQAGNPPAIAAYLLQFGMDPDSAPPALLQELSRIAAEYRRASTPAPDSTASHVQEGGDLGSTAPHPVTPVTDTQRQNPLTAGRYQLLGEIGRGGMGVVYRAHEPSLGREVAVKLLHERYRGDPVAARRFLAEAQVTSRLQHPGIPPVFEVGTLADGSPYLAMKLILGRTLSAVMEAGELRGPPLLAVFESICQAVGYAHSRGVIHRDLKPANVMVGAFGEVQVMDWGLAREMKKEKGKGKREDEDGVAATRSGALDAPDTQPGQVMGTPAYMAPEQAAGRPDLMDERADVFGLGAIACTILTDQPPFVASTAKAAHDLAVRCDMTAVFARLDACGADPEQIALCKRCLSPDREARPRNAGAVAAEVAALREAADERARRAEQDRAAAAARAEEEANTRRVAEAKTVVERKKRRVQLALAAAVGLLVAAGGAFAWWEQKQTDRRESDRRLAEATNRQGALTALDLAEAAMRKENPVYGEIDAALDQAEQRLAAGGAEDLRERFAAARAARQMLARLDKLIDQRWSVARRKSSVPDSDQRWSVARGESVLDIEGARDGYRAAFKEYGFDLSKEPPSVLAEGIRRSLIRKPLEEALDSWLALGWGDEVLELIAALEPNPERTAIRRQVAHLEAESRWILAAPEPDSAPIAARKASFQQQWAALETRVAAFKDQTASPSFAVLLGSSNFLGEERRIEVLKRVHSANPSHFGVAATLGYELQSSEVAAKKRESVAYLQIAIALRPTNATLYANLGSALSNIGDLDSAQVAYEKATLLDPQMVTAHAGLGGLHRRNKNLKDAEAACRRAVALEPNSAQAHAILGHVLYDGGDRRGAEQEYREAIRLNPMLEAAHQNMGDLLRQQGDYAGAEAEYRLAIKYEPQSGIALTNLGDLLKEQMKTAEAEAVYRAAIKIAPTFALAHSRLALVLKDRNDLEGAIAGYREAIRLEPRDAQAHYNLGLALRAKDDLNGALAAYQEAVRIDPTYAIAHNNLGLALRDKRDLDGAVAAFQEATKCDPKLMTGYYNLGAVCLQQQRHSEAADAAREVIKLDKNHAKAHEMLGFALQNLDDEDGAADEFRTAIKLGESPEGHIGLGQALLQRGDFAAAATSFKSALALGARQPGWRPQRATLVEECEELIQMAHLLPRVQSGAAKMRSPDEAMTLGWVASRPDRKQYSLAFWVYDIGFRAAPGLLWTPELGTNGARAAVRLAAGEEPGARIGVDEWYSIQAKARVWFAADLAAVARLGRGKDAGMRAQLAAVLTRWERTPDFHSVRDLKWLAAMPDDERRAWEALWAEVRKLREELMPKAK